MSMKCADFAPPPPAMKMARAMPMASFSRANMTLDSNLNEGL
jgi:hypothetical protein